MKQERLICGLPKGELEKVDFVLIRASDIPRFVKDETSSLKFGITASDIIWESGMGKDRCENTRFTEF